jgi:mono/diheme cytochrome c family protein
MKLEPGMAYNTKRLNKVFAVLSIIFLFVVIWLILDDYIRPWKGFQVKALKIKQEVLNKQLRELAGEIKPEEVQKLRARIAASEKVVAERKADIKKLEENVASIKTDIYAQKILNGDYNAQVGALTFQYDHAVSHGDTKHADQILVKLNGFKKQYEDGKEKLKILEDKLKSTNTQIGELRKAQTDVEKELSNYVAKQERLEMALEQTKETPVWFLRNSPFVDFLDPTIKIQQVVVTNAADDRYFQKVPKVDRCTTCHVFIDQAGYEEQANPYKTHPKVDTLAVGLNSAHPMKDFGCTTCHGGEGHRVNDFNAAAHTPENEEQRKKWQEAYNWHEGHKIPQPMFKLSQTEASCVKCHQGQFYIPQADKLNKGRRLIAEYGCYNCHKIKGWEGLPKSGPILTKISSKISKEFAKNWIWSPRVFNPKSRMPSFFGQSNNSSPEFMKKNMAEVNAMVDYIWAKSKDYQAVYRYNVGNAENGKELIGSIGCIGCHQVEGIESSLKSGTKFGPYLTGLGSKLDPDWLVTWLKKPNHYNPNSRMPSLRLTDSEANDIATYLLNSKNEKFKNLKFAPLDKSIRDELLVSYLSAFDLKTTAEEKVAKMSDEEKTMELGYRSIGKYGCYSCHTIDGFDPDRAPIGPELTNEGSKPETQFGFGIEKIPHTRESWIWHHLQNPARWDAGAPKAFSDLNRMPNFYLANNEIDSIVIAILGQVSDYVPLQGQRRMIGGEEVASKSFKTLAKYNCQGCHKIDGVGGAILEAYEDKNEGPPQLNKEGFRVQTEWLNYFLNNVHPIRPWLKVRMPSYHFSSEERNDVLSYFQGMAGQQTYVDLPATVDWEPGEREAAVQLFNNLACTSCHAGGFTKDVPSAPNLHNAKKRLRPDWIEAWLLNPQEFVPGTVMPSFWEGGVASETTILGGDSKKQIRALRKYIQEVGIDSYPAPLPKNQ